MSTILAVQDLVKTFAANGAATAALRGVDLAIAEGEFVAVMGPSGCGKSTLLHLMAGLDRPTAGQIHLQGKRVDGLSEGKWAVLRRRQIGFVFQALNLIDNLTVADNIELPALLAGQSTAQARATRDDLLERLGLADRAPSAPARLSGGERQRVAIARALINRPSMLLADEPTGNLDTDSARDVLRILRGFNADGQTVLLVTHDPRVASSADRVVRMRDGLTAKEKSRCALQRAS